MSLLAAHVENARAFTRFFFHARVLRPIAYCDPSTSILGFKSRIPVFASGAALAKLGHPLGEANITRGCGKTNTIQMVSSNASLSYAEIAAARVSSDQPLFFQLYKHKYRDDDRAAERVREVVRLGYKVIWLTVDAPFLGDRERDMRAGWRAENMERLKRQGTKAGQGKGGLRQTCPGSQKTWKRARKNRI